MVFNFKSRSSFFLDSNGLLLTRLGVEMGLLDHNSQGISGEKDSFPTT